LRDERKVGLNLGGFNKIFTWPGSLDSVLVLFVFNVGYNDRSVR